MLYYKFIVFSEKSRMGGEFRIRIIQNTNGLKFEINYRELSRQGNDGLIVALWLKRKIIDSVLKKKFTIINQESERS